MQPLHSLFEASTTLQGRPSLFNSSFPRRIEAFLDRVPDAFGVAEQPEYAVPDGSASGECFAPPRPRMLVAALAVRPLRGFFGLATLGPLGWALVVGPGRSSPCYSVVYALLRVSPAPRPPSLPLRRPKGSFIGSKQSPPACSLALGAACGRRRPWTLGHAGCWRRRTGGGPA